MARLEHASTFTAVGLSAAFPIKHGDLLHYSLAGTFVATMYLERSQNNGASWERVYSHLALTSATSGDQVVELSDQGTALFRFRCFSFTSGTVTYTIGQGEKTLQEWTDEAGETVVKITEEGLKVYDAQSRTLKYSLLRGADGVLTRPSQTRVIPAAGNSKAGTTSGWVVAAADNLSAVTLPQSKSASTLVIPIPGLKVGDTITGFSVAAQIEAAGNTVTIDADLRKMTVAAADLTDASVATITQVSAIADTAVAASGTPAGTEVVAANEIFYVLITATTGATTDIALQGITITVTEA